MPEQLLVPDPPTEDCPPTAGLDAWEAAYLRFETPEEQRAKFVKRLQSFGVEAWDRNLAICELLCGQGNGLVAWERLGFGNLAGLDISRKLLDEYEGPAKLHLGDARHLPFDDERYDVVSIQGGLHHLRLMDDLEQSLGEIRRVLKPQGKLLLVEPWLTPFLRVVHVACESSLCRKAWNKLDALATMIDHERDTYFDWLSRPQPILERLEAVVEFQSVRIAWGKLMLLGVKR